MTPATPQRNIISRIFLSPDEPRLRAGWRLFAQLNLMLGLSFFLSVPFFLFMAFLPLDSGLVGGTSLQLSDPFFLVSAGIQVVAAVLSIYLARRFADRRSFTSLGLAWDRRARQDLAVGVGLAGLMIGLVFAIEWAAGWLRFEGFAWTTQSLSSVLLQTLAMLAAFIIVGWYEEVLFRGYWLRNLSEGLNLAWGAALSSLAFGIGHAANPGFDLSALAGLTLAGLFFVYCYQLTGQLWLPIGLHIGWNFFVGTVFGFQVSGLESQIFRLVEQTVDGPALWTGGGFGPEAGLVLLPALALGVLGARLYASARHQQAPGTLP